MIIIICIHENDTLQIMAKYKQQTPNLGILAESYKTYLADNLLKCNYNLYITNISHI